jgi:hypothetical protein
MGKSKKPERNELGDIRFKMPEDFWQKQRERDWTHVFHFKDKHGIFIKVDYDGRPIKNLRPDLPRFELVEVEIFKAPDSPPYDDWMRLKGKYEYLLEKHFRPVFANKPRDEERPLGIEKSKVVIPKERYAEFKKFIAEFGLAEHEDFILFLLCKMEETYIEDIEYDDRPEQRERIRKFPQEVENLIKALKLTDPHLRDYEKGKMPPELEQITFHFNTEDPIKLTDRLLLSSITDATRRSFNDGSRKDWEKQLRGFPSVYNENQQPNEFRHRMCKALHNFFKDVDAFNFGKSETKDQEIYAIAWMMYFTHIKFFNKAGKEYDLEIDRYDLRQVVRLQIRRKELVYRPTQYTADELKPDFEKLLKYFDKDFLRVGPPVYTEHNIRQVFSITDRFEANHLFPELLHLFNCLEQYRFMVGHQMEAVFNPEADQIKDYHSLKTLIQSLKAKGKISEMEFKLEGNTEQFGFAERLPLEIMEQALLEYYENHKADFEVDLYESKIELGPQPGSFRIVPSGRLNLPQNRFLPVFIRKAYQFLMAEAPPGEYDYMPSERYFTIIALLLLRSWYFGHQMWDERHIVEQVKYWHSLK